MKGSRGEATAIISYCTKYYDDDIDFAIIYISTSELGIVFNVAEKVAEAQGRTIKLTKTTFHYVVMLH